ncbi:MAG: IS110 family transposase [Dorea sp.]|nr:IS110 family transposase [Dorea sp.]
MRNGSLIWCVMAILRAIISGETNPVILSNLAKGKARNKLPEMCKALEGRVLKHQRKMPEHQFGHIEILGSLLTDLDAIPGIGRRSAERILAETGVEMEHFQNESRFSSWAGLVPECKDIIF